MIRKYIFLAYLTFNVYHVSAQAEITYEKESSRNPSFDFQRIAVTDSSVYELGLIPITQYKSQYYIEKYNAETLNLIYQTDLEIDKADKYARLKPVLTPPVGVEHKGNILVFYLSKHGKRVQINYKLVTPDGKTDARFQNLVSSKHIHLAFYGQQYPQFMPEKAVINYSKSNDDSSLLIEITSKKYHKIFIYKLDDLIAWKTDKQEIDTKELYHNGSSIAGCFYNNGKLITSLIIKNKNGKMDVGIGECVPGSSKFDIYRQETDAAGLFSMDHVFLKDNENLFITAYEKVRTKSSGRAIKKNTSVKLLSLRYNLKTHTFSSRSEQDFLPDAQPLLQHKAYPGVEKKIAAANHLQKIETMESENFIFQISHLSYMPSLSQNDPLIQGVYHADMLTRNAGMAVMRISRDILVNKFDKSGKLIRQFLLPKNNQLINWYPLNELIEYSDAGRHFGYLLMQDDLHFIYQDNSLNVLPSPGAYIPNKIAPTGRVDLLAHFTIKNNNTLTKENLTDKNSFCIFYVQKNTTYKNSILIDNLITMNKYGLVKVTFK